MTPDKIKRIAYFEKDKSLGVFAEIQSLNDNVQKLIEAVNTSKMEKLTVTNLADAKTDITPLQANFEALKGSMEAVKTAIQAIPADKEMDMSGMEKLLKIIAGKKEAKEVDVTELKTISGILDNVLFAVQETASHSMDKEENPADKIVPELQSVQAILKVLNDNVVAIDIPDFNYEQLARIIKENLTIKVAGGGGPGIVGIKDTAGNGLNPATSEKQDSLITKQTTSNFHLDEVNKQTLLLHKILVTLRKIDLHLSEASGTTFEDGEIDEED